MKKILNIPNRTLFLMMFVVVLFWFTGKNFNVYSNIFTGALFEILSLPMIVLPVCLAALAIWNIFRTERMDKIWPVFSLVLFGVGVWWIVYN
jgi:hypothetical protein